MTKPRISEGDEEFNEVQFFKGEEYMNTLSLKVVNPSLLTLKGLVKKSYV